MAAVTFEEEVSRLAARAVASSPALGIFPTVRTAVGALARCSASRGAVDALVYLFAGTICVLFAATLPCVVPFWDCGGDCTMAWVLWEIVIYSGMLSTLLMAPALALFFLRAAGSEVKDDVDGRVRRWPRLWGAAVAFLHVAILVGLIGLLLKFCGFPEVSYLLRVAAVLCKLLFIVFFSIRAAVALWRMNPQQPTAVAVAVV